MGGQEAQAAGQNTASERHGCQQATAQRHSHPECIAPALVQCHQNSVCDRPKQGEVQLWNMEWLCSAACWVADVLTARCFTYCRLPTSISDNEYEL